ncbi:Decapping nuclease rai1 [Cryomyces minteri]|uniref:Decapping nuclease n=1 Tax=Cryomyces minteri TaxID=331657 RepID=A0A4U0Y4F1_9PEZI|nr:Decapping nuclease rai1 [Cryomyces minteri]
MAEFRIQPLARFEGSSAAIRRPKEIACFSYDENHQLRLDDSSLRYYYPPRLPVDLSQGFDTFKNLDDNADDHLDALLTTIMEMEKKDGKRCEADVVTWRGMMTKIMAAPFDYFNDFEMNATCFQGTIFLEENHSYKLAEKAEQNSKPPRPGAHSQQMMSYWGYKFETLCLLPAPWGETSREYIEGRENEVVSNYAQYCSVVKTGIGNISLVLGGEVDAVWDTKPTDPTQPTNWIELKTAAAPLTPADALKHERKLLKFWIQSFLLGVPRIVVGFRSASGILTHLEELDTRSIPGNVKRQGKASWDGNVCINFAAAFLDALRKTIGRGEGGVWRIRRRERSPVIEIWKVEDAGTGGILSREFVAWREELRGREGVEMQG